MNSAKFFKSTIKVLRRSFPVMLQTLLYSKGNWVLQEHSKDTPRAFQGYLGTEALGHSKGTWTFLLAHPATQGTWALGHLSTHGIWALEALEGHLDTQAFSYSDTRTNFLLITSYQLLIPCYYCSLATSQQLLVTIYQILQIICKMNSSHIKTFFRSTDFLIPLL